MLTGSELIIEMLRRSYTAADGLWFVTIEEELGLERALELDERVWRVMPKIQARKARELLEERADGPRALVRCMALKLAAEGYEYKLSSAAADHAEIVVTRCPWREMLQSSDRTHLGPQIADRICVTEGMTWAREFGDDIAFEMTEAICHGADQCRFTFRRTRPHEATE